MSLAPYVRILARGQGRARSFTMDEAFEAMRLILSPEADREAVGAILMLMRMKGETAEEIAGFAAAARTDLGPWPGEAPALDWPTYAAGRSRGLPWFLLSARLVASAGVPVLLHGWNSHQSKGASVRDALGPLGIPQPGSTEAAADALGRKGLAYLPLETFSPGLMSLLRLRDVLGLRSCVNTVCRMLNPAAAPAAVQGVFHPSYRELQADAARLLALDRLTVLKGGGGEFEHHPAKDIAIFGLRDGQPWTGLTGQPLDAHRRLADAPSDPGALTAIWTGERQDDFAEAIVLSTAALALDTAGIAEPEATARNLWDARARDLAA
ncbi:Anthranilate phosphoribosyltransferase [Palleronia marisminoris]|uniref:Bifunctional protein TrpGD n=1 Tax=Palleronia marisminoris TaxID=315423 RepID=A0A1Y5S6Y9_9RHOB|nr:glycosyl transferase family protein [Palleronia marisminoris]SFG65810.1 Anthranilate phosphoribosyltransferase [Palleronia marisminoris]SLN33803.1 Bifunctional protein TrpGD [Palleronia marisminoris]